MAESGTYQPEDLIHRVDPPTDVVSGLSDGIFYVRDYNDVVTIRAKGAELVDAVVSIVISKEDGQAIKEKGTPWVLTPAEWSDMLRLLDRVRVAIGVLPGEESGRTIWHTDFGPPSEDVGSVGDFYVDQIDGAAYFRAPSTDPEEPSAWEFNQYIRGDAGNDGTPGSIWFAEAGTPPDLLGITGDFYLNETNGDVYEKVGGTWTIEGNIRGPAGGVASSSQAVLTGVGAPSTTIGIPGDFYNDTATDQWYRKDVVAGVIAAANKVDVNGAVSGSSYATGSWTPTNSRGYLCAVTIVVPTGSATRISSVTGNGLTFVQTQGPLAIGATGGQTTDAYVYLFYALETSGTSAGATTVNLTGADGVWAHVAINEFTNVKTTGSHGADAFPHTQSANLSGGPSLSSFPGAAWTVLDKANNGIFTYTVHRAAEASTPGTSATELSDSNAATPVAGWETNWHLGTVPSSVTYAQPYATWATSSRWANAMCEIVAALTSEVWTLLGTIPVTYNGTFNIVNVSTEQDMVNVTLPPLATGSRIIVKIRAEHFNTAGAHAMQHRVFCPGNIYDGTSATIASNASTRAVDIDLIFSVISGSPHAVKFGGTVTYGPANAPTLGLGTLVASNIIDTVIGGGVTPVDFTTGQALRVTAKHDAALTTLSISGEYSVQVFPA